MDKEIYTRDPISVLEEREVLQQIISLGVGYPHVRSWGSKAAISDAGMIHRLASMMTFPRYCYEGDIIHDAGNRIRNGEDGYYLIDLRTGYLFSKGKHPIEEIIIQYSVPGSRYRYNIRMRERTFLRNMAFLILPNSVFFVGVEGSYCQLKEFHMLSFVNMDNSKTGFVVDYDVMQNNRPLVIFPCEENYDIIQDLLDKDDHCFKEERKAFLKTHRR